jgi:hypothetical protein
VNATRLAAAIKCLRREVRPCSGLTLEARDDAGSQWSQLMRNKGGVRVLLDVEPLPGKRYWLHAVSRQRRQSCHLEITHLLRGSAP